MVSKKDRILDVISNFRGFKFCGPSDDLDMQTAVCVDYHYLLTQLKRLASPYLPKSISKNLNNIQVKMDDIFSVYEASAEMDALLDDIERTIQGLDELLFDRTEEREPAAYSEQGNRTAQVSPLENTKLFVQITKDITRNPEKYREAGEWLDDKFYNEDSYWNSVQDRIDDFEIPLMNEREGCPFTKTELTEYENLKYQFERKDRTNPDSRLLWAMDSLNRKYVQEFFLDTKTSKSVCLIAWLFTDRDIEVSKLGLTRFEETDVVVESSRFPGVNIIGLPRWYWLSPDSYKTQEWTKLILAAWTKVSPEEEQQTKPQRKPGPEDEISSGQGLRKTNVRKKQGRPPKYTDELCLKMQNAFDQYYYESNDKKDAWSKVAEIFGAPSGKAAEMACRRHAQKRTNNKTI